MKLTAAKKNGCLTFHRPDEFKSYMEGQEEGQLYHVELKPIRATKTNQQLAYYYAVVIPSVIQWMIDMGWDSIGSVEILGSKVPLEVNIENTDSYLKILYATSRGIRFQIKKASMTKLQMMDFIDFILSWALENFIIIPSPPEKARC